MGQCRLEQHHLGTGLVTLGRVQQALRSSNGQRREGVTNQIARRDPDGAPVSEANRDIGQAVGVMAGLQGVADPRERLANFGQRVDALEGLGPEIVGPHDAILCQAHQRHSRRKSVRVNGLAADRGDHRCIGPADKRQSQQGPPQYRWQAIDDLLPQELVGCSWARCQGQANKRRPPRESRTGRRGLEKTGQLPLLIPGERQVTLIQLEATPAGAETGEGNLDRLPAAEEQMAVSGQAARHLGQ